MINKKMVVIITSSLLIIISIIIVMIMIFKKDSQSTVKPVGQTGKPLTVVPVSPEALPTNQASEKKQNNNSTTKQNKATANTMAEKFVWGRVVYYSDNDSSVRLLKYFKDYRLGEKLVVDFRNINKQGTNLTELDKIMESCQLVGDPLNLLPLVYNRSAQKCYWGYDGVVGYLNKEIELNK